MKVKDEHSWLAFQMLNIPKYSFLVNAAKEWANAMDELISEGNELTRELAEECFSNLQESYTRYQHSILTAVLGEHWIHGESLESIYNLT